jgi:hypothetical protein
LHADDITANVAQVIDHMNEVDQHYAAAGLAAPRAGPIEVAVIGFL